MPVALEYTCIASRRIASHRIALYHTTTVLTCFLAGVDSTCLPRSKKHPLTAGMLQRVIHGTSSTWIAPPQRNTAPHRALTSSQPPTVIFRSMALRRRRRLSLKVISLILR